MSTGEACACIPAMGCRDLPRVLPSRLRDQAGCRRVMPKPRSYSQEWRPGLCRERGPVRPPSSHEAAARAVVRRAMDDALSDALAVLGDLSSARRPSAEMLGRVSAVCPTTDDRVLFHPQLYRCFLAQTWCDKELVVVDTGERASPFLERTARLDARVVYRHFRVPATAWPVGLKRNLAAQLATGEILMHFDDDDLYAPCYMQRMFRAMVGHDAVTLSSWFVCDPFSGVVGHVVPQEQSGVLGYGFSHAYTRRSCLLSPFPHVDFAEDYLFLLGVQSSPASRGVATLHDDDGIVLHMQHGANMSTSHARRQVPLRQVRGLLVMELSGMGWLLPVLESTAASGGRPFSVSFGATSAVAHRALSSPHLGAEALRALLRAAGACASTRFDGDAAEALAEHTACVSWRVEGCRGMTLEPGRVFASEDRFPPEALVPPDVPKVRSAEMLALLHAARVLAGRCSSAAGEPCLDCQGVVQLRVRSVSHMAISGVALQFTRHFQRVRLEVCFCTSTCVLPRHSAVERPSLDKAAAAGARRRHSPANGVDYEIVS